MYYPNNQMPLGKSVHAVDYTSFNLYSNVHAAVCSLKKFIERVCTGIYGTHIYLQLFLFPWLLYTVEGISPINIWITPGQAKMSVK